jgi:hypothetical protein
MMLYIYIDEDKSVAILFVFLLGKLSVVNKARREVGLYIYILMKQLHSTTEGFPYLWVHAAYRFDSSTGFRAL